MFRSHGDVYHSQWVSSGIIESKLFIHDVKVPKVLFLFLWGAAADVETGSPRKKGEERRSEFTHQQREQLIVKLIRRDEAGGRRVSMCKDL